MSLRILHSCNCMGQNVDDNNEPAPGNIPAPVPQSDADGGRQQAARQQGSGKTLYEGQEFGWDGIDHQKKENFQDIEPRVMGLNNKTLIECQDDDSYVAFFCVSSLGSGWRQ